MGGRSGDGVDGLGGGRIGGIGIHQILFPILGLKVQRGLHGLALSI